MTHAVINRLRKTCGGLVAAAAGYPRTAVRPRQFRYKSTRDQQLCVAGSFGWHATSLLPKPLVPADEVSKQRSAKRPELATTPRRPSSAPPSAAPASWP